MDSSLMQRFSIVFLLYLLSTAFDYGILPLVISTLFPELTRTILSLLLLVFFFLLGGCSEEGSYARDDSAYSDNAY